MTVEAPTVEDLVAIPMHRNIAGQPEVAATVNGTAVRLMVDTGASHTLLDTTTTERLGLIVGEGGSTTTGVGGTGMTYAQTYVNDLRFGTLEFGEALLLVVDLGHVNTSLEKGMGGRIDGILGIDVLRQRHAIIDCGKSMLYLSPSV